MKLFFYLLSFLFFCLQNKYANTFWFQDELEQAELIPAEINLFVGDVVKIYGILKDTDITNVYFEIDHKTNPIRLNASALNSTHYYTYIWRVIMIPLEDKP